MSETPTDDYNTDAVSESDYQEIDIHQICSEFFTDPKKNRNIPEVLLEIKRTLDVHNKLLQSLVEAVRSQLVTPERVNPV